MSCLKQMQRRRRVGGAELERLAELGSRVPPGPIRPLRPVRHEAFNPLSRARDGSVRLRWLASEGVSGLFKGRSGGPDAVRPGYSGGPGSGGTAARMPAHGRSSTAAPFGSSALQKPISAGFGEPGVAT